MNRGFLAKEVEGLYYLRSENKGADLHLCFCICKIHAHMMHKK